MKMHFAFSAMVDYRTIQIGVVRLCGLSRNEYLSPNIVNISCNKCGNVVTFFVYLLCLHHFSPTLSVSKGSMFTCWVGQTFNVIHMRRCVIILGRVTRLLYNSIHRSIILTCNRIKFANMSG